MKRILSFLLLAAMLVGVLSLFAACKAPAAPGSGGGGGNADIDYFDHLDETGDSFDFSAQEEFVLSFPKEHYYEVYGEENSNEKLDTLIHNRNRLLEGRFGLTISKKGEILDNTGAEHYEYVQLALSTGDVSFDAVAMNAYQAGKLILGSGGVFLDFRSEVPYVQESIKAGEEWWPSDINTDSTVMGRQFVAVSDFCITAIEMSYAVIFNRDLAGATNVALGVNNYIGEVKYTKDSTLYDVVRGNDWTLDVMKGIVKGYWRDNPNVGRRGERDLEDRFGLVGSGHTDGDAWAYALGYNYVINDGVAAPDVWEWNGSQFDAITSLRELYYSNGAWTGATVGDSGNLVARSSFFAQTDRVLFELNTLGSLKYDVIHEMEQNFGVLPYPKYDRDQAKHLTGSLDNYSALAVPTVTAWADGRLRMTGALLEALSAENCKSVKNPFYDEIVTHYNVTDGDSVEMIDLIVGGRVYDLGVYHYNELVFENADGADNSFALFFRYLIRNKDKDITQYWMANSGTLDLQMDALLDRYASIL